MKVLFINACVREASRTRMLAERVLGELGGSITELDLGREGIAPLTRETLQMREDLLHAGNTEHPMLRYARQFAEADEIVIAAPYWDLSFPALLKIYFEQISATGVTFTYREGRPEGLCRARRLTYVTTAGGAIFADFGYSYVKALATSFYGIPETRAIRAENLDVLSISPNEFFEKAEITTIT